MTDSAPTCWQLSRGARGQQHAPVPTIRRSAPPSVFLTKWLCALVWYTFSHPFETDCRSLRDTRVVARTERCSLATESMKRGSRRVPGRGQSTRSPRSPRRLKEPKVPKLRCPTPRSPRSTRSPRSPPGPKSQLSQEPYELSASCASGPVESKEPKEPRSPRTEPKEPEAKEPSQRSPNRSRSPDEPKG